jgi:hypothetical protein
LQKNEKVRKYVGNLAEKLQVHISIHKEELKKTIIQLIAQDIPIPNDHGADIEETAIHLINAR